MKTKFRGRNVYIEKIDNQIFIYRNIIDYLRKRCDPILTVLYRLDNNEK